MHLSELEGLLGRHWPEMLIDMDVWRRKTQLELLVAYPCPAEVTRHREEAREVMRRASRNTIKEDEIKRVLDSQGAEARSAPQPTQRATRTSSFVPHFDVVPRGGAFVVFYANAIIDGTTPPACPSAGTLPACR
jgi:hypothetical protein